MTDDKCFNRVLFQTRSFVGEMTSSRLPSTNLLILLSRNQSFQKCPCITLTSFSRRKQHICINCVLWCLHQSAIYSVSDLWSCQKNMAWKAAAINRDGESQRKKERRQQDSRREGSYVQGNWGGTGA